MLNRKLCLLSLSLLVTACGGGSAGSDNNTEDNLEFSQPISYYGRFVSSKRLYGDPRALLASFREISPPTEYAKFRSEVTTPLDTCRVIDSRELDNGKAVEINEFLDAYSHVPTAVSAGAALEVYDNQGFFQEILESNVYHDHTYSHTSGEHPDKLMVNIPGDSYPGIQEVQIPDKEALVVTSIDFNAMMNAVGFRILKDHIYKWVASANPNSRVHIDVTYSSDTAETKVFCRVKDDGEFTLTERIKEMITDDMYSNSAEISRYTENRIAVSENAVLDVVTIDVAENP